MTLKDPEGDKKIVLGWFLGLSTGALGGFAVAKIYKKQALAPTAIGALVGGAIGGQIGLSQAAKAYRLNQSSSVPVLPPPPAPPLQPVSGGSGSLTVSPSVTTQTVALNVQDPVLVSLPAGASWVSMDGAPVADKASPIAFTFLGPISHTFVWTDATNANYQSTYFFVLNPSATPTTNA